ncbi:MAG TPA: hypothetical protein VJ890_16525 [Vineibacter sp.]|nr:hypothetical protein [Vineibacter sp.]
MTQAADFPSVPSDVDYQPDFARQAEHLCRLGGEPADLAAAFRTDADTIADWLAMHPEFAQAVARGQAAADAAVTTALFRRACGFELRSVRWLREDGKTVAKTFTREVAPDRQACMIWLRHRRPDLWGRPRSAPLAARRSSDASVAPTAPPLPVAPKPLMQVLGARHSSDASCRGEDQDARQESRAPSAPTPTPSSRAEPREARCSRGTLDRQLKPALLSEGPSTRPFGPWSGRRQRPAWEIALSAAAPRSAGLTIERDLRSTSSHVAIEAGLRGTTALPAAAGATGQRPWAMRDGDVGPRGVGLRPCQTDVHAARRTLVAATGWSDTGDAAGPAWATSDNAVERPVIGPPPRGAWRNAPCRISSPPTCPTPLPARASVPCLRVAAS